MKTELNLLADKICCSQTDLFWIKNFQCEFECIANTITLLACKYTELKIKLMVKPQMKDACLM
jgi:hypothetical protein